MQVNFFNTHVQELAMKPPVHRTGSTGTHGSRCSGRFSVHDPVHFWCSRAEKPGTQQALAKKIFCKHLAFQKTSRWGFMCLNSEVACFLRIPAIPIQPQPQKRKAIAWEWDGVDIGTSAAKKPNGASHLLSGFHMCT